MNKLWMTTKDAFTIAPEHKAARHAPRHAAERDHTQVHHTPYDHRMSDRFRPSLSTR